MINNKIITICATHIITDCLDILGSRSNIRPHRTSRIHDLGNVALSAHLSYPKVSRYVLTKTRSNAFSEGASIVQSERFVAAFDDVLVVASGGAYDVAAAALPNMLENYQRSASAAIYSKEVASHLYTPPVPLEPAFEFIVDVVYDEKK